MGYLMRVEEKRKLIKHIKLGTSEVLYYPYTEGKQPLPLRPISSWELDDCFYRALNNTPDKIADFIVKVKLDLIDRKTNINVENSGYVKLMRFYNEIDYWIVYYAMKDFQDSEFSVNNFDTGEPYGINIVKKMLDVHKISKFVLTASYQPKEIIKEIIRDDLGKELGILYLYLNVPFAEIKDITSLQRDFMVYTKGELPKVLKGDSKEREYTISGEKTTVRELMRKMV
jgi:hypothetical protein